MPGAVLDTLEYARKLENGGYTREQAATQAEALKNFVEAYDAAHHKELATKKDIHDVRMEIQDTRREIQDVRVEMKSMEIRLLKWQIGGWLALAAIMAKGFGWLGF